MEKHDDHREHGPAPFGHSPRVVVKFRDSVPLPYEDGAEKHFKAWGVGPWDHFSDEFPACSLRRVFTVFPPEKINQMVRRAVEMDSTYRPAHLLGYFAIDCPARVEPQALVNRLAAWPTVETAYVQGLAADPVVNDLDDPIALDQGYLDPAPAGIDARFAWTQPGGDGAGIRVIDLEQGWTLNHEDLTAQGAGLLFGAVVDASRPHGTAVLGEMCAVDNTVGCVGIAPHVAALNVVSHSGVVANIPNAIVKAIDSLSFGDALLLEVQLVVWDETHWDKRPIETDDLIYDAIRLATALGIVVVEAAGNGGIDLDTFASGGKLIFNRSSADFRDSGAIMVGAATAGVPHSRCTFSNHGSRIDCYGWGEQVDTDYSDSLGATNLYTTGFDGTSSASPIVTGAALDTQGMAEVNLGFRFSPKRLRAILSDPANGTPSNNPPVDRIGVMPDLHQISANVLGIAPDVYLRDHVGDNGDPHTGAISASPDIILRPAAVADPQASFGAGSGTENSNTLGFEAVAGQPNYIYVRMLNRGGIDIANVQADIYWSPPATLVSPNLWNPAGSVTIPNVPAGDVLTVSTAITWNTVPATGHYCFVGLIGNELDPAPTPADFVDFGKYETFIRANNNVTWRNFNVVPNDPAANADPAGFVALPFLAAGAADKARRMALEIVARLPRGARILLEAPIRFIRALDLKSPYVTVDPTAKVVRIPVNPHGTFRLGDILFAVRSRAQMRLLVSLPEQHRRHAYDVFARQTFEGREVGRVTWRLAPRRKP